MRDPKRLTRDEVLHTARHFTWLKKMPKWTVIISNRELPARPLVLEAAGVPPNSPTNSHQAVAILENLGFETRYARQRTISTEPSEAPSEAPTDIASLVDEIQRITSNVPDEAWDRLPADLSKNVDHYLYGTKKIEE
jgi:hypothetical protein